MVTTEVAVCSFCGRPRTLRHEEHQLGTLVRTIITCETCHRTLSSTIGVATTPLAEPEPIAPEPAPIAEPAAAAPKAAERPAKSIVHRKAAATKATTPKSRPKKTR